MKYLMCTIQNEDYAIAVNYVQEILPMMWIHRIPDAPSFLEGMLNRRGVLIPVIDLSKRIGLSRQSYPDRTRIVIVQIQNQTLGLIIDVVHDIHSFAEDQQKEGVLDSQGTPFIKDVLVNQETMIQILVPEHLLSASEKKYLMEVEHG